MATAIYPWQQQAWTQLQQLQGRWPHAILLHGPDGIGKTVFAEYLAQSLLCESPINDGHACGTCLSCGWCVQQSHPDFRRLRPASLDAESAEADSESEEATDTKATKTLSKEIVINQVRSLADFLTMSTHRSGMRVIVIYPADAMNGAAANALLKSLEEPGPNTVFILVASSVDSLLPTLVSRCRQFALTPPSIDDAMNWLKQHDVENPEQFLSEQGGAPLAALASSQSDTLVQQQQFLLHLQHPDIAGAIKIAEKMQKTPMPLLLSWMQRWLYDIFSYKLSGKIRYYPRYQKEIAAVAAKANVPALLEQLSALTERRRVEGHPLAPKLVIEEMLLDYVGSL